ARRSPISLHHKRLCRLRPAATEINYEALQTGTVSTYLTVGHRVKPRCQLDSGSRELYALRALTSRRVEALIARARRVLGVPRASADRNNRSALTDGSPDSIFATRD